MENSKDIKPTFHHLNNSQSQRILWLLEELEIPYDLKLHQRQTSGKNKNRAPDELKETHSLGKSPQLETGDGRVITESAAIAKYLIEKYDTPRRFRGDGSPKNDAIRDEELCSLGGTSINPIMISQMLFDMTASYLPFFIRPIFSGIYGFLKKAFFTPEMTTMYQYLNDQLGEQDYFMGSSPSRPDFVLSWPVDFCVQRNYIDIKKFDKLNRWYERCHERKAWKESLRKGNGYNLAM